MKLAVEQIAVGESVDRVVDTLQEQGKLKSVMIVAGEASSDEHAGALARRLKERNPDVKIFGMGGRCLKDAGGQLVVNSEEAASVMGFTEVFAKLGVLRRALLDLVELYKDRRPDVVVLVDFPDFNFLLLRRLRKQGARIVYFVSPQLWAWRQSRVKLLRSSVDHVAAIFPFEEPYLVERGVSASYVGHPFLDRAPLKSNKQVFFRSCGLDSKCPVVALLPGSRKAEVDRLLAPMVEAFLELRLSRPGIQAIVPVAEGLDMAWVSRKTGLCLAKFHADSQRLKEAQDSIRLVKGSARECLTFADAAVVTSGTSTVEAALSGVPFVVVYKMSELTYRVARLLVRGVRYVAMANLLAGEQIVPELLQEDVSPQSIRVHLERFLGDPGYSFRVSDKLKIVRKKLEGRLDLSLTASDRVISVLEDVVEHGTDRSG